MDQTVRTVAALEAIIGKMPPPMNLKVIDHLDAGAQRWIGHSPLMFCTFGTEDGIAVSAAGGAPGAVACSRQQLRLGKAVTDSPGLAAPGVGFGAMFLLPGVREILRVNGKVAEVTEEEVLVDIDECYGHCGKALLRSEFWNADQTPLAPHDPETVAGMSRFIAFGTMDAEGRADCSPKGDPAGSLVHLDGDQLVFADRPGNKRIDSFKNIITQSRVAALLVVPGSATVVQASGMASLTTDEVERERFTVQEKTPALVTCIRDIIVNVYESQALARADLWPVSTPVADINIAQVFSDHVKLNKGITAKLLGAAMSIPGLLEKGMEQDYKKNLY